MFQKNRTLILSTIVISSICGAGICWSVFKLNDKIRQSRIKKISDRNDKSGKTDKLIDEACNVKSAEPDELSDETINVFVEMISDDNQ